jgi:hypothetical protein
VNNNSGILSGRLAALQRDGSLRDPEGTGWRRFPIHETKTGEFEI